MPFCRECGKPVEDEWQYCPVCNAPQKNNLTNSQTDEIIKPNIVSDSVIMGGISTEVKYETTVNKTIINDNETIVISHMKSMIETMNIGNIEEGFAIYNRAKQIDFDLAVKLYNSEYIHQIVEILYKHAVHFCNSVMSFKISSNANLRRFHTNKYRTQYNSAVGKINYILELNPNHIPSYFLLGLMINKNKVDFTYKTKHLSLINLYKLILLKDKNNSKAKQLLEDSIAAIKNRNRSIIMAVVAFFCFPLIIVISSN